MLSRFAFKCVLTRFNFYGYKHTTQPAKNARRGVSASSWGFGWLVGLFRDNSTRGVVFIRLIFSRKLEKLKTKKQANLIKNLAVKLF